MLRITQQTSSDGAKRYYAAADYYQEENIGLWGGLGAARLGLSGQVDKVAFERLCDNRHPLQNSPLTVRTRGNRTVGYDFTFSVPKSVSLLYALHGDDGILRAFRAAVRETMADVEAEMKVRVRRGGTDGDRVSGNLVWADFLHTTSRPIGGIPDPQLHVHAFVFNASYDTEEGRWKAGQFRGLKADAPYFQAKFRSNLANKLQDLGHAIERKRDDFEIACIPAATLKKFSRRTELIEKVAKARGISDPDLKAELGAKTREAKDCALFGDALKTAWSERLHANERAALDRAHRRDSLATRQHGGEAEALDHALEHCLARASVVSERALLTEALKRGLGRIDFALLERELAGRALVRGQQNGVALVTTPAVLEEEQRLLHTARRGRGKFRPLGNRSRPMRRPWLHAGQQRALGDILDSRDFVTILRGAAGTGKTTLEQELVDALHEAGHSVVALAPTAEASRGVLRNEAKIEGADTVARFLVDEAMQSSAKGGVVLVDEASLLGRADMLKLFDIADRQDARVILVGDRYQHRAVSAGEPLRLLEERAGLPVARVTDVLRQQGDYQRVARALIDGDICRAFTQLDRLGWVREISEPDERYRQLAAAYLDGVSEKKANGDAKTVLVVSPTHAELALCTGAIRDALQSAGRLQDEKTFAVWQAEHLTDAQKRDPAQYEPGQMLQFHQHAPGRPAGSRLILDGATPLPLDYAARYQVYRPATLAAAKGDRIRITANGKTKDGKHRLDNGSFYTIADFTPQGDVVLDNGWCVAKDWGHWTHGYAVTSHASQGKTVDKVLLAQSTLSLPAGNLRQAYVSLTRGREQALVFCDSKQALLEAVSRPDEPMSATEFARGQLRPPSLRGRLGRHLKHLRRLVHHSQTPSREPPVQHDSLQPTVQHGR